MALLVTLFLILVNFFNAITNNSPKADGLNALQVRQLDLITKNVGFVGFIIKSQCCCTVRNRNQFLDRTTQQNFLSKKFSNVSIWTETIINIRLRD